MHKTLRLLQVALIAPSLLLVGCPHRSPLWSPDGKSLIVLAGADGEDVDKAASQLWWVDVEKGRTRLLAPPTGGLRYLAAVWLDPTSFLVVTGRWDGEYIEEGTEKFWKRTVGSDAWTPLAAPPPNEARTPKRLPVVLKRGDETLIAYANAGEKVVVASLRSGEVVSELEPAEIVGPGPGGGFLVYRPDEASGATELVAFDPQLSILWKTKFSDLRKQIAAKLGKKPVEIVFNDTSTSHLPLASEKSGWVGVNLIFSDVGWKEGLSGFHARLDARSGSVLTAVHASCLPGVPSTSGGLGWGVTAPEKAASGKTPPTLRAFALDDGREAHAVPLGVKKERVHGYSIAPEGRRLALVLNGPVTQVVIYDLKELKPRVLELK